MTDNRRIGEVITDLYACVSGPAGHRRDWARLRALFTPWARMVRTAPDEHGRPRATVLGVDDYGDNFEALMAGRAFFEFETHRVVERFGNIAHAFSSYEAYGDAGRTQFLKRGINSIQLFHDGDDWRVAAMIWDDERPGLALPERYRAPAGVSP